MPEVFQDLNLTFQVFPYDMRIQKGLTSLEEIDNDPNRKEIARYNLLGQKITQEIKGIQIIVYDDGSTKKINVSALAQ